MSVVPDRAQLEAEIERAHKDAHDRLTRVQRLRLYAGGADTIMHFAEAVEKNFWRKRAEALSERLVVLERERDEARAELHEAQVLMTPGVREGMNIAVAEFAQSRAEEAEVRVARLEEALRQFLAATANRYPDRVPVMRARANALEALAGVSVEPQK